MRTNAIRWFTVGLGLFLSTPSLGAAQNLLVNPGFEVPAAGVMPPDSVAYTKLCQQDGLSAAENWNVYVNDCGADGTGTDISTQLLPSTAPSGGNLMMHVVTNGGTVAGHRGNGIFQSGTFNVNKTRSSIWVFVNTGCVGFGTGDGGATLETDEITCVTGQWIQFQVPDGISPANEVVVYAVGDVASGAGGADYYVDNGVVVEVRQPVLVS